MKLTPLEKRAARKERNHSGLDMNLVALIDIFTILIFFLMSSTGVEILSTAQAVKLPQSTAEKMPREMLVVTVSATDILVDGRKVATVAEAMGIDALDPAHDRAMICGSPQMLADFRRILDGRGFTASPRIGTAGEYVFERAFVEK